MRYAMRIYFLVLCLTLFLSGRAVAQYAAPAEEEIHRRVGELLSKMTVEEKAGQLNQVSGILMPGFIDKKPDEAIRKEQAGSILWLTGATEINRLQISLSSSSRATMRNTPGERLAFQKSPLQSALHLAPLRNSPEGRIGRNFGSQYTLPSVSRSAGLLSLNLRGRRLLDVVPANGGLATLPLRWSC
jgi:hypothetical protein